MKTTMNTLRTVWLAVWLGIALLLMGVPAGAADIAYVAGSTSTTVSGEPPTITLAKPTGVVDNDVLYSLCLFDALSSAPTASGWTQIGSTINTPSNGFPTTLMRHVAASDGANYVFTITGASLAECVVWAYRNANATTPEDVTPTSATGTVATVSFPSITTTTNCDQILLLTESFNALTSNPSGYTARLSGASWTTDSDKQLATAGTVSGVTATGDTDWVARTVAVRPASATCGVASSFIPAPWIIQP